MSPTKPMSPKQKMKNNTTVYLAKGERESSALLKSRAVQDYFGNTEAELAKTEKGKPIISFPEGHGISVSHSGGVLAVVIAPYNVGIDIQERLDRDNSHVIQGFFHESERDTDFYSLWVRKEAYGKLTGDGVFALKGKKLDENVTFTDISEEISQFAGKAFSAVIATDRGKVPDVKFIGSDL